MLRRLFSWLRVYIFGIRYFLIHTNAPIQGKEFLTCTVDGDQSIKFFLHRKTIQRYRVWYSIYDSYPEEVYELRAYIDEGMSSFNRCYTDIKLIAHASDFYTDDLDVIAGVLSEYYLEHISRIRTGKPSYITA